MKLAKDLSITRHDFKEAILESVDRKCQRCKGTFALTIHHKNHDARDHSLSNLEILCRECHDLLHYGKVFSFNSEAGQ